MMNKKEIGSEFHAVPNQGGSVSPLTIDVADEAYVFSGRTAMETVLRNLTGIRKVLLPSYCCDSMIEPFRAADISVEFYPVSYGETLEITMQIADDIDLVLWCNYFGFSHKMPDFTQFISRGGIVVEDITHSLLSAAPFHAQSQYVVASVRKWFPLLCGGYCAAVNGKLKYKPESLPDSNFLHNRRTAMEQKTQYLSTGDKALKDLYMHGFAEANGQLAAQYSGRSMDPYSQAVLAGMDVMQVRKQRIQNAAVIYKYLQNCNGGLKAMFPLSAMDCPLFVPVVFSCEAERNAARQRLIAEEIYCPVHWPQPNGDCRSVLYGRELSLVCDQRYDENDMERMMQVLIR